MHCAYLLSALQANVRKRKDPSCYVGIPAGVAVFPAVCMQNGTPQQPKTCGTSWRYVPLLPS